MDDGSYYRHACPDCGAIYHDAFPMRACERCGSGRVETTFDADKRAAESGLRGTQLELFHRGFAYE